LCCWSFVPANPDCIAFISCRDEPNSDRQRLLQKREREFHQEVQETVITVMAPRLNEFVHVLKNPPAVSILIFIHQNQLFIACFAETYVGNYGRRVDAPFWQDPTASMPRVHRPAGDQA